MPRLAFLSSVLLAATLPASFWSNAAAADISALQGSLEKRYSTAHSLGDTYQFDPRDGWQAVNVTNLQYKYSRSVDDINANEEALPKTTFHKHGKRSSKKRSTKSTTKTASKAKTTSSASNKSVSKAANGVLGSLQSIINTIKAIGSPEPVTITWYTGHDLLNPSCWSNPSWAPTDESFACALTLDGWTTRPKCFKFLELCTTSKKCVFVRVVDSCAGCAPGSKHVDLTKAAFTQLADLSEGVLTVQMREATDPDGWLENLWGPKEP